MQGHGNKSVTEVKYLLGCQDRRNAKWWQILDTVAKKCTDGKILVQTGGMLTNDNTEKKKPISHPESYRLCNFLMVCCPDSESKNQTTNCTERKYYVHIRLTTQNTPNDWTHDRAKHGKGTREQSSWNLTQLTKLTTIEHHNTYKQTLKKLPTDNSIQETDSGTS